MRKIRSGQSYLYRDGGICSTVLDVRMKDKIRGDLLRRALETTIERYPYLSSKLVEKDGDFYIASNPLSLAFAKTDRYRALGSMEVNYHLIDVTYSDRKIRIAFHHALCDGRGIKPFVETLVYYYCCLKYNKEFPADGIRLAGEPLLPGETDEPFKDTHYEVEDTPMPDIIKDGYSLPENQSPVDRYYRYEVSIPQQQFIRYAKQHNATPAILIALLASKAIKHIHDDADKPIVCSMASDMRKEMNMENTHKNCVSSLYLPYTDEMETLPLSEQASRYRAIIKEQKQLDVVKRVANSHIGMCDKLDELDTFSAKKHMLSFFNDLCIDTFILSYLGQFELGEHAAYVDAIHLYGSGTKGLILNMTSAADTVTIDILQSFESECFMEAFTRLLETIELDYTISSRIEFATTSDKTFATAKFQAEKYYGTFED